jgi:hypothetical protein
LPESQSRRLAAILAADIAGHPKSDGNSLRFGDEAGPAPLSGPTATRYHPRQFPA